MNYEDLLALVQLRHLTIFGTTSKKSETIVLLGPYEPSYWPAICSSPEWNDEKPDPIDRWSIRIIEELAQTTGARACFPFGSTSSPFLSWALASDQAWQSPVGMVVQAEAGLLVSYRGALIFDYPILSPVSAPVPCTNCARPCLSACPVNALKGKEYDIKACVQYIKKDPKQRCINNGCLARLACPISANYPRSTEQSAYHMRQFLK